MPPVGPRASKEEFMQALGLNSQNPQHEQYYRAMRDVAIIIYNRLNENPSNLLDSVATDPTTRPPFFWHHIRPDRQHWGILEIVSHAGPLTEPFFARGNTTGEYGPNWVAGWLLYSVFRSRDVRNNRNRRKGEEQQAGQASKTAPSKSKQDEGPPKKEYYDPVRNG
ncbi:uncharacterized protein KD926_003412 [Aspergillus affinis]|uniref:uncharacterized protein n=1 Tax=Aspergillus affinis TaxID=1070780 RepID=UPI0022FE2125|nr:uncharacterized protein KD926_003412 [Aspergillus affinis]KAI9035515.1 hypothetical protein KD926_003412 [Aspergillus affinis]